MMKIILHVAEVRTVDIAWVVGIIVQKMEVLVIVKLVIVPTMNGDVYKRRIKGYVLK